MNRASGSEQCSAWRAALLLFAGFFLVACDPFAPEGGSEFKDCRYELERLPGYRQLSGGDRLQFIHQCMERKGLQASEKCKAAGAQGKLHCAYEQAP